MNTHTLHFEQMSVRLLLTIALFMAKLGFAHTPSQINANPGLHLKTALSMQSGEIHNETSPYLIPGILLGSEAIPNNKGTSLDDLQLTGRLKLNNATYVAGKLGYHQHSGTSNLNLDNFWFGRYVTTGEHILKFDAGIMATSTTPTASFHASQDDFRNRPLLADVFFGGHHRDSGIKAVWYWQTLELGIEMFNGASWPYQSKTDQQNLYGKFQGKLFDSRLKTDVGVWYSKGKAIARQDTRYDTGHHHDTTSQIETPDGQFTGEIIQYGYYIQLQQSLANHWSANLKIEGILNEQSGVIISSSQLNQSADVALSAIGVAVTAGLKFDVHQINLRHEIVAVNNKLFNTTSQFIDQQGLNNLGFEPTRTALNYRWQFQQDLFVNVEALVDKSSVQKSQHLWSISLIWQHKLL